MPQTFRELKNNIGEMLQLQVIPSNKDERFYVNLLVSKKIKVSLSALLKLMAVTSKYNIK